MRAIFLQHVRVIIIVVCLMTKWLAPKVLADEVFSPIFTVQGTLKFQINTGAYQSHPRIIKFEVAEDRLMHWKIILHENANLLNIPITNDISVAYDGINMYGMTTSDLIIHDPSNGYNLRKATNAPRVSVVNVSTGPYPLDFSSSVGVLWLTYIAGSYLDLSTNQMKFPDLVVTSPRLDPMTWSCDFVYSLTHTKDLEFIQSGKFFANPDYVKQRFADYSELDEPENNNEDANRSMMAHFNYLKSLKTSSLAGSYEILETTNLSGFAIPARARFQIPGKIFGPGSDGFSMYEVLLDRLGKLSETTLLPPLPSDVTFRDRRMREKVIGASTYRKEAVYKVDDQIWPTDTNDLRILKAVAQSGAGRYHIYEGAHKLSPYNKNRNLLLRWLIIAVAVSPILYFGLKRFKRSDVDTTR